MTKLDYAYIIDKEQKFKILADLGLRLDFADKPKLMPRLVDWVAPEHLELLAESRSILNEDGYWLAESDSARRKLIKGAYELHRYKGTPWAIREIVRRLGFGEITLVERMGNKKHNGEITRNGYFMHGYSTKWAHYRVILNVPITVDQSQLLRKTLAAFAPARCVLDALDFQAAALRHNGLAARNGKFTRGTV